ncbi:MAG: hypothetical protein NC206_07885 [Bacteroides sp.]|nr:hypothetical protein [Roseburia sp.]MCM1346991.1 hypothetical protein [Bacteroides sp.]MCM1421543.1 hypothetical protein [Bacteroides sp.]
MHTESGLEYLRVRITGYYKRIIGRLRLLKVNRELLVFFVFLCVAIIFWFLQTFKEEMNIGVNYKVSIYNVPKNVIFTSPVPETIKVNISGRGFAVLEYLSKLQDKTIHVDFSELSSNKGYISIGNAVWRNLLAKEFNETVRFVSTTPAVVGLYYSTGQKKRVPVVFNGQIRTGQQHLLCGVELNPDSVDVYASSSYYDSITVAYTENCMFSGLEDTLHTRLSLKTVTGVKYVPDSVDATICVDLFTEKTLKLPIYCENIPQNKILRTFPLVADVTFHVSATMFDLVSENDFALVVDYNSIRPGDEKCRLQVRSKPNGVTNLHIYPETVEYIIEQIEE